MIIAGILPISNTWRTGPQSETLLAFIIVCLSVMVLRKSKPNIERPIQNSMGFLWFLFLALRSVFLQMAFIASGYLATAYYLDGDRILYIFLLRCKTQQDKAEYS